jgi:hypothetical protein
MGYIHPHKPDIFVSYAVVDDAPLPAFPDRPGWVTTLVRGLRTRLARKLGGTDSCQFWSDAKLAGHVELTPEILGRLHDAAVLLLVLSPAYLVSERASPESAAFHEEVRRRKGAPGRVFIVEFDRIDPSERPPELADPKGYRFWIEDPDTRNTRPLGYPIVLEKDEAYFERLDDLCIDLARVLKVLRQGEQEATLAATGPALRTEAGEAVYLAEVTEDLETRRDTVRRHLDQAGYRVLPEGELARDDHRTYRAQVQAELARSIIFVQLLSEDPGRPLEGFEASGVAEQHERAVALGKPILQWRRRELDTALESIPDDHRRRLTGATVVSADISEFKGLIVETVERLTAPPSAARDIVETAERLTARPPADRDQRAPGDPYSLVFVNAEETDWQAADQITDFFEAHGVGTLPPVRGPSSEEIRERLTTRMRVCDGMVLVHGNNPDWPVLQFTYYRKVKSQRDAPIRAIGICDLPPPDRPMKAVNVLRIPLLHVIDCCHGLAAHKFQGFLQALADAPDPVAPPIVPQMAPQGRVRDQVFVSYSRADRKWLVRLQEMLTPLVRGGSLMMWDDTRIQPGAEWKVETEKALASAKVAVLLVSSRFLASDFIANHQLPPLLRAAQDEGATILWVPVSHCLYEETAIASYKSAHDPAQPLESLRSADRRDKALRAICREIKAAVEGS